MARLPPSSDALLKLKWQLVGANGFQTRPYGMSQNPDVWEMARLNCRP